MTKMGAMVINSKQLLKICLQNQRAYDLETWHKASRRGALQNLYKSCDGPDLLNGKVKIGRPCIGMEKISKM